MRLLSSVCASCCRFVVESAVITSVVSSAYVYTFEFGTVCMMLLMYSRKKVVDSVLSCGIPCVMVCVFDCACWVCVDCLRFVKYDLIKAIVLSVKLNSCSSLCNSLECRIVSNALDRSM